MPKRTSDVPTSKSEGEIVQSIDACLTKQGFHRSGPKNKFVWRRGLYWTIFVSTRVTEGMAHFEVWNFVPLPGLGSFLIYFFNTGQLDAILEEVQKAALSDVVPASLDDTGTPSQIITEPPKKTLTGFAKAWIIFWIVANLAATWAPSYRLSDSTLGGVVAMVMLLSAAVAVGYILLLYKKPIGLYLILLANFLGLFLNNTRVGDYSITVTTGLIVGILTFFVTRKQVAYPFGRPPVATGKVDDAKEREVAPLQTPGKTATEAQPPMPAEETAPPPAVSPESLAAEPASAKPASASSSSPRAATAEHTAASSKKRNAPVVVLAIGLLALCVPLPICLVASIMLLNPVVSNTFSNINAGLNPLQPKSEINTRAGTLVISKAEFASSLPPGCSSGPTCNKPKDAGHRILILWLDRKDGGKMEEIRDKVFDEVKKNLGTAYVTTSDGYKAPLAVAQFVDPRFALGFVLPMTATRGLQLTWPGNPIIDLGSPQAISPPSGKAPTSIKQATPPLVQVVMTATPRPSPTNQPTSAVRPQAGYWQGPAASFDVTSEGKIRNFRLAASDVQCTLKIDELSIKPDGTFELVELIEERNYWPGADREALKAKNVWPTPVMTEKGAMIEAQRINGRFVNASSLSGSYKVLVCGSQQVVSGQRSEPTTWTAEWRGAAAPTSTPNATVTPTKTALTATSTSTRISPTPTRPLPPTTAPIVTPAATAPPAPGLHCDNPNAQITSPGMNQVIRGIVPLMGDANIPDFLYYKIQFMPESSYGTDKWGQLFQGKTPVPPTGKLMEWHTYTVEPGAYWLRLIVADRTGNYPDPCDIRVQVER